MKQLQGQKETKESELTANKTFKEKSIGASLPIVKVKKNLLVNGINIIELVMLTTLSNSKSEVRRMIQNNGLKINNIVVGSETDLINQENFDKDNNMKVSHGKKQHVIVKII